MMVIDIGYRKWWYIVVVYGTCVEVVGDRDER